MRGANFAPFLEPPVVGLAVDVGGHERKGFGVEAGFDRRAQLCAAGCVDAAAAEGPGDGGEVGSAEVDAELAEPRQPQPFAHALMPLSGRYQVRLDSP
jgi:hypothetical protein